jgi:AcrR family transcriptional regulator
MDMVAGDNSAEASRTGKRRGRPRTIPRDDETDPRDDILDAAGRLFIQHGFVRTTTRQIAEAVGLQQGSLFHYFARKQDILFALLDSVHEPPARLLRWLRSVDAEPDVKLYLLARLDSRNLCSTHNNLGLLYLQNEILSNPDFKEYAEKRDRLRDAYTDLIREGVSGGHFAVEDVRMAGCIAFGLVESSATWFTPEGPHSPEEVGTAVGEAVLRVLKPGFSDLSAIQEEAERIALAANMSES